LPQKGARSLKAIVFYAPFALFRGYSAVLVCILSCGLIGSASWPAAMNIFFIAFMLPCWLSLRRQPDTQADIDEYLPL
jgi:hypothetical protein